MSFIYKEYKERKNGYNNHAVKKKFSVDMLLEQLSVYVSLDISHKLIGKTAPQDSHQFS